MLFNNCASWLHVVNSRLSPTSRLFWTCCLRFGPPQTLLVIQCTSLYFGLYHFLSSNSHRKTFRESGTLRQTFLTRWAAPRNTECPVRQIRAFRVHLLAEDLMELPSLVFSTTSQTKSLLAVDSVYSSSSTRLDQYGCTRLAKCSSRTMMKKRRF